MAKIVEKFIITDPCYIMDKKQYGAICDLGCDFEGQKFPFVSARRSDGKPITFHLIDGTGGDGSTEYNGQQIGVDAGMLCIAESADGWKSEKFGATFEILGEARNAFKHIIKQF